jgi:hypothetical protein
MRIQLVAPIATEGSGAWPTWAASELDMRTQLDTTPRGF